MTDPRKNTYAFSMPTASFHGFNSALQQEHFHENYLESSKFPTASFAGKFIEDLSGLDEGTHEVRAKGMLKIHGESVERIIKCHMALSSEEISVRSEFTVPLSDHNISVPQVVHQKIAEEILVEVQILMKRQ
ncbi:MAG: YceI family protein [Owenweeksia sp.]|nr:YceI family protein [Owenweeksia sp.]